MKKNTWFHLEYQITAALPPAPKYFYVTMEQTLDEKLSWVDH